jgi:thiol-disulfide isomerase/thioredoxin
MKYYGLIWLILALSAMLWVAGCKPDPAQSPQTVPPPVGPAGIPQEKVVTPRPLPPAQQAANPAPRAKPSPAPSETVKAPVEAKAINWLTDFEAAKQEGGKTGKYLLLFFHTEWCGYCRLMEEQTFPDARVMALITKKFIPVKLDAEKEIELSRGYNVTGYPTTVIVDPQEREVGRVAGYLPPENYLRFLSGSPGLK